MIKYFWNLARHYHIVLSMTNFPYERLLVVKTLLFKKWNTYILHTLSTQISQKSICLKMLAKLTGNSSLAFHMPSYCLCCMISRICSNVGNAVHPAVTHTSSGLCFDNPSSEHASFAIWSHISTQFTGSNKSAYGEFCKPCFTNAKQHIRRCISVIDRKRRYEKGKKALTEFQKNFKGLQFEPQYWRISKHKYPRCFGTRDEEVNPTTPCIYKMAKHTLKILRHLLKDFYSVYD